jgi:perosamine synthetase
MSITPPPRQIQIATPSTGDEEWQALREPLTSGWLTQGPKVAEFERQFARRHSVTHALATTSATTGLHLALAALGIGPGDEVIIPSFTWVATANAVMYCGATPVIADIDLKTFNLDPEQISARLTVRTRAVIAVHLFGLCADIDAIKRILPPSVTLIEDAACAAGASLRGMPAGSLGEVGVFSFHPRKSITTGEGGMLTTNNAELAGRAEQLRNHGATVSEAVRHHGARPYLLPDFNLLGFNYRMTELQAAVGIVQLRKLDNFIDERSRAARYYNNRLSRLNWLKLPEEPIDGRHAWQSYVSYVDEQKAPMPRNQMMDRLQQKGIATRPGTHAVHMLGYYRGRFEYAADDFPNARDANDRSLAIPLHNRMSPEDYAYVADTILGL